MKKSIAVLAATVLLGGVGAASEPFRDTFLMGCAQGYTMAEDSSCVPEDFWEDMPPVVVITEPELSEDDPNWDCRVHGNELCGVEISGTWYVVQFENGEPVSVEPRGF